MPAPTDPDAKVAQQDVYTLGSVLQQMLAQGLQFEDNATLF